MKKRSGAPHSYEESSRIRGLFLPEEKQATRRLYEQVFTEDSPRYVDYYYSEKCRDNVIFIKESRDGDGWQVISMIHLNPYALSVCGKRVRTCMIAAVATDPLRWKEGHMRDTMLAALSYLEEQDIPFTYLLPVDERIYTPFGFETVCRYTRPSEVPREPEKEYDIFILPDPVTEERFRMEARIEEADRQDVRDGGNSGSSLPPCPVIMAKVTSPDAFDKAAGTSFENDAARLTWLRGRKICIQTEV